MTEPSILLAAARTALPFIPALLLACFRVSILLAVSFGALWILKQASAKLRHILWLSAIAGSLVIFALTLTGPVFHVPLPHSAPGTHGALAALSSALLPSSGTFGLSGGMPPLAAREWRQISTGQVWLSLWPSVAMLAWIAGAAAGWLRIIRGRLQLLGLSRKTRDTTREYERMVRGLSRRIGIRRKVSVAESELCVTPMTRGIIRPVIFLPSSIRGWSPAGRQSVLLHELRHVRRGDSCTLAIAYWICSLLWFVPPVWAAYARLYLEQEKACDEAVIESGVRPQAYAACILDAAQLCREPALFAGLNFSGGRKKILKDRIRTIVGERKSVKKCLALSGLAALLLLAAALLGATGQDPGKRYGSLYLTEYRVRNADEARILDTLIQFENGFNSHSLQGMLSVFVQGGLYMPRTCWYTKFPVASPYCQRVIEQDFGMFKFQTFYDPAITVSGDTAVVRLLLETGDYLDDFTFTMEKEAGGWRVLDAWGRNDRVKS